MLKIKLKMTTVQPLGGLGQVDGKLYAYPNI